MTKTWISIDANGRQDRQSQPPQSGRRITSAAEWLEPALLPALHQSFRAWGMASLSPGAVTPERIWITAEGRVYFRFANGDEPIPQSSVGSQAGLAAWLILLDKYIKPPAVIATARPIWPKSDLAGALIFTTPGLLPAPLLRLQPNNWERVARSLAASIMLPSIAEAQGTASYEEAEEKKQT